MIDVIFAAAYVGTKLYEKFRKKQTLESENPAREQGGELSGNKTDEGEEGQRRDYALEVSTASVGLATIGAVTPTLTFLRMGSIAYIALPVFKGAHKSLVEERKVGNDVVVSLAIVLSMAMNQYLFLSLGGWFYHLGSRLAAKVRGDTNKKLAAAFAKHPYSVRVRRDGAEVEIPFAALDIGDIIAINAGDEIPIDGAVAEGQALVDQRNLTGEDQPAEKGIGDRVFASTAVMSGRIFVEVEKIGNATTVYQIGQILDRSSAAKTSVQVKGEKWADKGAAPCLIGSALALPILGPSGAIIVLFNSSIGNRIRLLAPLGTLNYTRLASQKGILVKDGRALEELSRVDTVLFDKTGTLTKEQPKVGNIILCDGYDENEVLRLAAAAESRISHPIARAIRRRAEESELDLDLAEIDASAYHIGYGVTVKFGDRVVKVGSARFMALEGIPFPGRIDRAMAHSHEAGNFLVMVAVDDLFRGAIEVQAALRPEVEEVVSGLRQRGVNHISIVSGDHRQPTQKLAEQLEVDSYFHGILPEDKGDIVEEMQREGKSVCFIGDGINDSIAMNKADVSISLSGASAVAKETAQVVLMDGSLVHLGELFDISKGLEKNLQRGLAISLLPSAINITGAFMFNLELLTSLIISKACLLVGVGNAMWPLKSGVKPPPSLPASSWEDKVLPIATDV